MRQRKEAIEEAYKKQMEALQQELEEAMIIEGDDELADLERSLNKTKKELEDSYQNQINYVMDTYKKTAKYQSIYASYQKALQDKANVEAAIAKREAKGLKATKNQTKQLNSLTSAINKYEDELAALAEGATEANISQYVEAWSYLRKYKTKYEQGKLTSKEATQYDKYLAMISKWNLEKNDAVKKLYEELEEQLRQLQLEYEQKVNESESALNERKAQLWETAKQIAEWEVTSLQNTINSLDAMINRYKAVAQMLENTTLDSIKKYGIMDLFDLDENASVTELLTEQLTNAIKASEMRIADSVDLANLYQELLEAADENSFEGIFAKYREQASDELKEVIDDMIAQLNENDYSDNEWITEWNTAMSEAVNSTIEAAESIQQLKDELREKVLFKAANEAIQQLDILNQRLRSMAGVIQNNWVLADKTLTEFGLAKINILGQEMANAQQQVAAWAEKIQIIQEAQNDVIANYGSEEKYLEALNNAYNSYFSALQNVESISYEIYNLGKQAAENEANTLKELTQARLDALKSKKAYYDYDKQLKEKTKDVEALKAQLEALNGINTAEAKAQRAQLESQLKDAEDALDDLTTQHQFELSEQALNDFISDLDKSLNNANKSVKETFEEFAETLKNLLGQAANADIDSAYQKIWDLIMGEGFTPISASEGLSIVGQSTYVPASSTQPDDTTSGLEDNIEYDNATYTPITQDDLLTSLSATAMDITPYLDSAVNNLVDIGSSVRDIINSLSATPTTNVSNGDVNLTLQYDNLISVNGSVDATVIRDLQDLTQNIITQAKTSMIADLKKVGVVRSY